MQVAGGWVFQSKLQSRLNRVTADHARRRDVGDLLGVPKHAGRECISEVVYLFSSMTWLVPVIGKLSLKRIIVHNAQFTSVSPVS